MPQPGRNWPGPRRDRQVDGTVNFGDRGRLADVVRRWRSGRRRRTPALKIVCLRIWRHRRCGRMAAPDGAHLVPAATGEPEPMATVTPGNDWQGRGCCGGRCRPGRCTCWSSMTLAAGSGVHELWQGRMARSLGMYLC